MMKNEAVFPEAPTENASGPDFRASKLLKEHRRQDCARRQSGLL
jgi:hypothetical protein